MLMLFPVFLPILGAILIACLPKDRRGLIHACMLGVLSVSACLALAVALGDEQTLVVWKLTDRISIALQSDALSRIYLVFISLVWLAVGVYSMGYNAHDPALARFDVFYTATYGILMGLSLSENAVTLYMFYEMMTLITLPLVMHTMERDAVSAGIKYLIYSVFGASTALLGIFFMAHYGTTLSFTAGGVLDAEKVAGHESLLVAISFLMMLGFGVKAGMFPMHAWLPTAHPVAPAPASAVLSGVITKMGVLGVIRVVFYLVGVDFLRGTWAQTAFMVLTLITVFMGSLMALREKQLKKRLAYSSVSQVSYVLFGLSTMSPIGFVGAILHIVCHSLIKNTLFMAAGAIIHETGKTQVDDLTGIGKVMPRTMIAFTIVSLGLIGIPPTGGFISKWYLAQGALTLDSAAAWIGPAILLCSALMTAAYLLVIVIHGFFPGDRDIVKGKAAGAVMWVPMLVLAVLSVVIGLFPGWLIGYAESISQMIF
ncbi:MAG: proton-conducting membrane transporter [Clostridia bacterium]|nr:proton-conducting membrane transporter [Clostridia bacterium]